MNTTTTATEFRGCDTRELLSQIGMMNVLAVSGGRVMHRATGVTLPVRYGYSVTVDLDWNDTYIVRRVFARAGKTTVKREWTDVYCDAVGEIAYQASCYLDA
jgi:hypothetical protein